MYSITWTMYTHEQHKYLNTTYSLQVHTECCTYMITTLLKARTWILSTLAHSTRCLNASRSETLRPCVIRRSRDLLPSETPRPCAIRIPRDLVPLGNLDTLCRSETLRPCAVRGPRYLAPFGDAETLCLSETPRPCAARKLRDLVPLGDTETLCRSETPKPCASQ